MDPRGLAHNDQETSEPPVQSAVRFARWPLFKELVPETLEALTGPMVLDSQPSGQLLLLDGERYERLYVVSQGFAVRSQVSTEGREHVLDYLGPGRFLNIVAVLDGGPQLGTIRTLTPVSVYSMGAAAFMRMVASRSDLALTIARSLAWENRQLSETARGLALDSVRQRLAAFLLEYAEQSPPQQRWTQDLIAAHIGTVRDVVGRILRDLTQEGLIRRDKGQLIIVDREGLDREAHGDGE